MIILSKKMKHIKKDNNAQILINKATNTHRQRQKQNIYFYIIKQTNSFEHSYTYICHKHLAKKQNSQQNTSEHQKQNLLDKSKEITIPTKESYIIKMKLS